MDRNRGAASPRWRLLLTALLTLAACSGGGDDPAPPAEQPLRLSFSVPRLTASFQQGDWVALLHFDVTVFGTPSGELYVAVLDPGHALDPTHFDLWPNGATATVRVKPNCVLEPGAHEGTITFVLCRDQACTQRYPVTGNTLGYGFNVEPGPAYRAAVDGVWLDGYVSACTALPTPTVAVGQVVTLEAGIPVTWSHEFTPGYSGGVPTVSDVTTTDTRWTGTIGYVPSQYGSRDPGFIRFSATPAQPGTVTPRVDLYVDVVLAP